MNSTAPLTPIEERAAPIEERAALIRVRGLVQGVGFRPTLWRLARRHGLRGWVANDGQGVRMHVCGAAAALEQFVLDLPGESPPLARIDRIEREPARAHRRGSGRGRL